MGSGHTHRKGRGNQRRPRNGPPRSQGMSGQNGHAEHTEQPGSRPASTVTAGPTESTSSPNPHAPRAVPQEHPAASAPAAPAPAPREAASGAARGPASDLPPSP